MMTDTFTQRWDGDHCRRTSTRRSRRALARLPAVYLCPLTNVTSPVYGRPSPDALAALASLLDDAISHLDPARPLMSVA